MNPDFLIFIFLSGGICLIFHQTQYVHSFFPDFVRDFQDELEFVLVRYVKSFSRSSEIISSSFSSEIFAWAQSYSQNWREVNLNCVLQQSIREAQVTQGNCAVPGKDFLMWIGKITRAMWMILTSDSWTLQWLVTIVAREWNRLQADKLEDDLQLRQDDKQK